MLVEVQGVEIYEVFKVLREWGIEYTILEIPGPRSWSYPRSWSFPRSWPHPSIDFSPIIDPDFILKNIDMDRYGKKTV